MTHIVEMVKGVFALYGKTLCMTSAFAIQGGLYLS